MPSQWEDEHRFWHELSNPFQTGMASTHAWVLAELQQNCPYGASHPPDLSLRPREGEPMPCHRCGGVQALVKCSKCWRFLHTHKAAEGYLPCYYMCALCGPEISEAKYFCSEVCHNVAAHSESPSVVPPGRDFDQPQAIPVGERPLIIVPDSLPPAEIDPSQPPPLYVFQKSKCTPPMAY